MAVLLGLATALVYGAADFTGGLATRRNAATVVVVLSQAAGFALLLVVLPFLPGVLSAAALLLGGLAGMAGGAGVALLYRGLAVGRMSVVAPVTAAFAATMPVAWGLALGERPGVIALTGIGVALVAIVLVSAAPEPDLAPAAPGAPAAAAAPDFGTTAGGPVTVLGRPGLLEALGSGLAFGAFFVVLDAVPADSGLWSLVGARVGSISLIGMIVLARRTPLRAAPGSVRLVVAAGVLDMAANVLYLLATREGLLALVAVLTSLYPASTVLLARVVLGERLTGLQQLGLGCAVAGITLIALG